MKGSSSLIEEHNIRGKKEQRAELREGRSSSASVEGPEEGCFLGEQPFLFPGASRRQHSTVGTGKESCCFATRKGAK